MLNNKENANEVGEETQLRGEVEWRGLAEE